MPPGPGGSSLGDPDDADEGDDAQTAPPWYQDIWGDLDTRFLGDGSVYSGLSVPNDDGEETEDET